MTVERLPLLAFYRTMSRQRRWQLAAVLCVTLFGALAELVTIGASLGFLALVADPARGGLGRDIIGRLGGDPVVTGSVLLVAAAIAAALIRLFLLWLTHRFVTSVSHDMAAGIFSRMLCQPYAQHVRSSSNEVLSGVEKVQWVVSDILQPAIQGLTSAFIALLIILFLFRIDVLAAGLATFTVILAYAALSRVTRRRLRANSRTLAETGTARIQMIRESLGGIRDIILDQAQPLFEERFQRIDRRYRRARSSNDFIAAAPRFIIEAAGIVAISLTALAMSQQPRGIVAAIPILGALTLGMHRLLPLLQQAYSGWTRSSGTLQPLADVLALMRAPITTDLPLPAGAREPLRWSELSFHQVAFRHGEDGFAIEDVRFTIARGSRTGISGPTGAGKSTLLDLIIGLLEPDAGTITVDGRPLDQASRAAWMAQIAHVPQAIYLADASIAANIAFGRAPEEIDPDRLAAAVTAAQLDAFIADLPDGLATRVGERGMMLSGGQRQRIGIARALYKPAQLLVLDEATSALDEATEAEVMAAIGALGDRTLVLVAHRRSTLDGCDRIIHVERGKVSVGGTPDEPVRPPQPFRRSIRSGQG